MDYTKTFELKVGVFIMIGIAILFIIVFSIGDIYIIKPGYHIKVIFSFASGIGPSAPVRLAGVGVGQVEGIRIFYDEKQKRTKAELSAWVKEDVKIEDDAVATINTLGLLGEKYLEIFPGTSGKPFLKDKDTLVGRDPVSMEKITENLAKLSDSVTSIADGLAKGEGTIGKLLKNDAIYNNLEGLTEKLNKGEGTFGKFLTDDTVYKNFEAFSDDIKKHPWKLLAKPRGE